jgi:hypothetical protein
LIISRGADPNDVQLRDKFAQWTFQQYPSYMNRQKNQMVLRLKLGNAVLKMGTNGVNPWLDVVHLDTKRTVCSFDMSVLHYNG